MGSVEVHDGSGARRRRYATGATRAVVEGKLRKLPSSSSRVGMALSSYLDVWLADVVAGSVRERTLDGYVVIVERHIKPYLGGHRVDRLGPTCAGMASRWTR